MDYSVYIDGTPAPKMPMTGAHVALLKVGDVVDVVLNNRCETRV